MSVKITVTTRYETFTRTRDFYVNREGGLWNSSCSQKALPRCWRRFVLVINAIPPGISTRMNSSGWIVWPRLWVYLLD